MALPTPLTILLRGQQTLTVTDAVSETSVDIDFYDGTTYRDDPVALLNVPAPGVAANFTAGDASRHTYTGSASFVAAGVADPVAHVAPRFHQKKRSMMLWWDGAAGTGNVVGKCWADQFIGYGDSAQFIQ
jgi:hypothetical protein